MDDALKRLKAESAVRSWKSWLWMVQVSLALLGLSTFLRIPVGACASRDFLRVSGSRVWMHSSVRLHIHRSCLLACRVSPYVAVEIVRIVAM